MHSEDVYRELRAFSETTLLPVRKHIATMAPVGGPYRLQGATIAAAAGHNRLQYFTRRPREGRTNAARCPAKNCARRGGTALPIIRATGSIWSTGWKT